MAVGIKALAYELAPGRLGHDELCARFGRAVMDKIAAASGIYTRRVALNGECASDFAVAAANKILDGELRKSIDLLIFATQTPDYLMPTTACVIQQRLGLSKDIAAFDINLGCTQFVYALAAAKSFIDARMARRALVLCGDTPTRLINKMDRSAASIFSDAGSACILEESPKNRLVDFVFGSDGAGAEDLICPVSGMRNPPSEKDFVEFEDENKNVRCNANLYINGFKIFAFAFKIIPQTVEKLLARNGLRKEDIDLFIFHQAGEKIITSAAGRLGLDMGKVYMNLRDIGNCGGSSVAIALADALASGRAKPGMRVLICAFGVGLSWGGAIIEI